MRSSRKYSLKRQRKLLVYNKLRCGNLGFQDGHMKRFARGEQASDLQEASVDEMPFARRREYLLRRCVWCCFIRCFSCGPRHVSWAVESRMVNGGRLCRHTGMSIRLWTLKLDVGPVGDHASLASRLDAPPSSYLAIVFSRQTMHEQDRSSQDKSSNGECCKNSQCCQCDQSNHQGDHDCQRWEFPFWRPGRSEYKCNGAAQPAERIAKQHRAKNDSDGQP